MEHKVRFANWPEDADRYIRGTGHWSPSPKPAVRSSERLTGTVKKIIEAGNYRFIRVVDGYFPDVFLGTGAVEGLGIREGDVVNFATAPDRTGRERAIDLKIIGREGD